jgi:amino acid transporter
MGLVEYLILIAFSVAGLWAVLSHHHGTFPITHAWLNLSGIVGHGSLASGLLISVFMFAGWDATVYVNEEVKHRRHNPGRAAVIAVAILVVMYTFCQIGLQGVVSPAKLQANSSSVLVYIAQALGGGGWAKVMALALALSVIASTGVSIVILARMLYGMASHRVLPEPLSNVSRRFMTPVVATVTIGAVLLFATLLFLLISSIQNAFFDVISVTGILYAAFYVLTAFATIVYFRRRVITSVRSGIVLGVLPLAASGFLVWLLVKSLQTASTAEVWSIVVVLVVGLVLMVIARTVLKSSFFAISRESDPGADPA